MYTATIQIYPLSLHDALPISGGADERRLHVRAAARDLAQVFGDPRVQITFIAVAREDRAARLIDVVEAERLAAEALRIHPRQVDRKSTRLNSSHGYISYAVFC